MPRRARAYYDALRARQIGHHAALRHLANRLVGILHDCLTTGTKYDGNTCLAAPLSRCRLTSIDMGRPSRGRGRCVLLRSNGIDSNVGGYGRLFSVEARAGNG